MFIQATIANAIAIVRRAVNSACYHYPEAGIIV
jgi:hypothetical protein